MQTVRLILGLKRVSVLNYIKIYQYATLGYYLFHHRDHRGSIWLWRDRRRSRGHRQNPLLDLCGAFCHLADHGVLAQGPLRDGIQIPAHNYLVDGPHTVTTCGRITLILRSGLRLLFPFFSGILCFCPG